MGAHACVCVRVAPLEVGGLNLLDSVAAHRELGRISRTARGLFC